MMYAISYRAGERHSRHSSRAAHQATLTPDELRSVSRVQLNLSHCHKRARQTHHDTRRVCTLLIMLNFRLVFFHLEYRHSLG